MMRSLLTQDKLVSGLLNTLFVGGLSINIIGHIIRLSGATSKGMLLITSGYVSLIIGFSLICIREYLKTGTLTRRHVPWLIIFAMSPPMFIAAQYLF